MKVEPGSKSRFPASAVTATVLLAPLAASVLLGWLCRIGRTRSCDGYVPALLAINVRKLIRGVPLYGDLRKPPYGSLLFGPIVPWLTAPLVRLFGPEPIAPLEAGRLLTICATIAVSLLVFRLARHSEANGEGASVGAALIGSLAFLLSPVLQPWGFEFRVDMPALAFELGGLALFQSGLAYAAVVLFVVSFFVKQMRLAGISAVLIHLWLNGNRRRSVVLVALWLVAVTLTSGISQLLSPYYWLNNYSAVTPVSDPWAPPKMLSSLAITEFPVVALAALGLFRKGPGRSLAICFLLMALLQDSLSDLRWGSNMNYFLPSLAALAIVASTELDYLLARGGTLQLPVQLLCGATIAWTIGSQTWLGYRSARQSHWPVNIGLFWTDGKCDCGESPLWDAQAMNMLGSIRGTVLTDISELVLMNAAPDIQFLDVMDLGNMKARGTFDDRALISAIEHRQFAAIALDTSLLDEGWRTRASFWPELHDAIARNYVLVGSPSNLPPFLVMPRSDVPH